MKPLALNLRNAKKTASDKHSSTFSLPSGHQIRVLHAPLSALQRKQISEMPVHQMADGGDATDSSTPTQQEIDQASQSYSTPPAPGEPWEDGDGGYRPNPQVLQDEIANREPASMAGDVGNYIGTAVRNGVSDATDAFKGAFGPAASVVGDAAQGLASGLSGSQDQSADSSNPLPKAATDLPGMGQPVAMGAPASRQMASQPASGLPDISVGGTYNTGLQGINTQQQAETEAAQARLNADKMYAAQQVNEQAQWENERQGMLSQIQSATNDVQNGHIQPNHYLENMNTGQHIATAIGLILGGAGAHSTGGQNMALNFLNNQIDRDISSQKANQENNVNVLGAYQAKYKDAVVAEDMARATQYAIYASKLQQAADQTADPMAKARALQAKAALQTQILPFVNRANIIQRLNTTGGAGVSPMDLVPSGLMSQEEATKEQGSIDNQKQAITQGNNLYAQIAKQQTLSNRFANPIQSKHQLDVANAQLASIVQSANPSERLTPESAKMEILPYEGSLTDSAQSLAVKKQGFMNHVQSKYAGQTPNMAHWAPGALPQYNMAPAQTQHAVGDIVGINGKKAQIIDTHGNYKFVQ